MRTAKTDDLEKAWVGLGERIDVAAVRDDESSFLTRLVLLLAAELDDADRVLELADQALSAGKAVE